MQQLDSEFTITRVYDAPRELVFQAWTEERHLARWWGPKGISISVAKLDARPGGAFHYRMQSADGHATWGEVRLSGNRRTGANRLRQFVLRRRRQRHPAPVRGSVAGGNRQHGDVRRRRRPHDDYAPSRPDPSDRGRNPRVYRRLRFDGAGLWRDVRAPCGSIGITQYRPPAGCRREFLLEAVYSSRRLSNDPPLDGGFLRISSVIPRYPQGYPRVVLNFLSRLV